MKSVLLAAALLASTLFVSAAPIAAQTVAPVPAALPEIARPQYTLLPGDVIDIHYRYTPTFDQTVTVPPDGYLDLNVVGRLYVAGLTMDQVQAAVLKVANDRLNQPEITISLKTSHTSYVVVAGQVMKPGKIDLQEGFTALHAIMLAGGFAEDARSNEVLVFRTIDGTTAEVHVLKLGRLDRTVDMKRDMALQSGDTIMVPHDRIFNISRYIKLANIGFYVNPLQNVP
jgi:protein involved in polysaccharide export with SLBB domain